MHFVRVRRLKSIKREKTMLGGKFNFGALMKGAKKIQEMVEKNQAELAQIEVSGESGAGLVKIRMSGQNELKSIQLSDELLSEPKEVIQDLIVAAVNSANKKVKELTKDKMSDISQLFGGMGDEDK